MMIILARYNFIKKRHGNEKNKRIFILYYPKSYNGIRRFYHEANDDDR